MPDGVTSSGMVFAAPSAFSTHAQLLPYVEATTLWNSINFTRSATFRRDLPPSAVAVANLTSLGSVLGIFLCPTDAGGTREGNNYRATSGPHPSLHDGAPWPGGGGVFPGLTFVADREIVDGLSHTIGFSERLRGSGPVGRFDRHRDFWYSALSSIRSPQGPTDLASVCSSLTSQTPSYWPGMGETWIEGGYLNTAYNHMEVPNWFEPDCTSAAGGRAVAPGVFSELSRAPRRREFPDDGRLCSFHRQRNLTLRVACAINSGGVRGYYAESY